MNTDQDEIAEDSAGPAVLPDAMAASTADATNEVRFIGNQPRRTEVPIDHHVTYQGEVWTSIPCERLTAGELDAFYDLPPSERTQIPTIKAPAAVVNGIDADDADRVRGVALGFLPLSLARVIAFDPSQSESSSLS